ncbi:alpha-ribazole phosphatase [Draconibacterium sp. IB214405]|uniref:alpha-ribazole phosphatase n=1 Tax=Draconibacterium sp. IB214405 TaxID=3097352 RepID=UPI002A0E25B7|nr:alpha-ribazole phosphatase [Draconibacterium sp. IB214405]MDX8341076.1 alpha-ribazole phosphatase [Draconibacterium sp. IB214405]
MKFYAIRHTSVDVKPGICYGQTDVDVAVTYEEEQKRLAKELEPINFEKIWSSPLLRCRKLAESLFPNEEIHFDSRLKELNFGDWEMSSWDEIYACQEGKIWMDNYQVLPTKNGESYPEMVERVSDFVREIEQLKVENIAVVAHAGVIRILKSVIEKIPISELFENFKPAYASVTVFEINQND